MYEMGTFEVIFWCITVAFAIGFAIGSTASDTNDEDRISDDG